MGYTNKTSHYELPQYVANDKPSWLGDFNTAMLKIDTVMANNDATAAAASSAATGAQSQVASLSAQISTMQGQINTAIDTATTADGKATTAQTVANQANTAASEAKTTADAANQTAGNALPKSGGTMTGNLILNGAPTSDNQAATKAYVDAHGVGVSVFTNTNIGSGTFVAVCIGNCVIVSGDYVPASAATRTIASMDGNPLNLSGDNVPFGSVTRVTNTDSIVYGNLSIRYDSTNNKTLIIGATGTATTDKHTIVNGVVTGG